MMYIECKIGGILSMASFRVGNGVLNVTRSDTVIDNVRRIWFVYSCTLLSDTALYV